MYQSPGGLAKLQAVLANRKYSYGGQLPSDMENQAKTNDFGTIVGGGIARMQRIFSGGSGGDSRVVSSTTVYNNNEPSGIARHQAIASRASSSTSGTGYSNDIDGGSNSSSSDPQYNNTYANNPVNHDNSSNLDLAGRNKEQPVNYKEMIPYLEKWSNRNFDRDANYAGLASLSNAFGRTGGFSTVFGSYTPR